MHHLYNVAGNKILYVTPEIITHIKAHVLAGVDTFTLNNCRQRASIKQDLYLYNAQLCVDGIRFTARYIGRCKWEFIILS